MVKKGKTNQQISKELGERSLRLLRAVGFEEIKASHEPVYGGDRYYIREYPYTICYAPYAEKKFNNRIYGAVICGQDRILVEVKYQKDTGTCDEKWPFIFANFAANDEATEFILLHDGDWWTSHNRGRAIVQWAMAEAAVFEHRHQKTVHVINFKGWCDFVAKRYGVPRDIMPGKFTLSN